jgi:hypothetical protein
MTKALKRQEIGPDKFDTFAAKYSWVDGGRYVSHAAPAAMFLQYASDEPFLNGDLAKQYFEIVSEPKKLKIYEAPHALNVEATRDRIRFLAEQLSLQAAGRQGHNRYPGSHSAAVAEASPIDNPARAALPMVG